jgi:hypothetical protein
MSIKSYILKKNSHFEYKSFLVCYIKIYTIIEKDKVSIYSHLGVKTEPCYKKQKLGLPKIDSNYILR